MLKIPIPFIPSRGLECGQACAAMMIKYYYPNFVPDFNKFNKLIHFKPGTYTFPLQNTIILYHYGVKVKCFSSDDIKTTQEDPEAFRRWFGKEYDEQIKFVDFDSYNYMVKVARKNNLFIKKKTVFNEIKLPSSKLDGFLEHP